MPIRLLVVDDHTLFRRGLTALLARDERVTVAAEVVPLPRYATSWVEAATLTPFWADGTTRNRVLPRMMSTPLFQSVLLPQAVCAALAAHTLIVERRVAASLRAVCNAPSTLLVALLRRLFCRRALKLGTAMVAMIAMMATATISSIREKPL